MSSIISLKIECYVVNNMHQKFLCNRTSKIVTNSNCLCANKTFGDVCFWCLSPKRILSSFIARKWMFTPAWNVTVKNSILFISMASIFLACYNFYIIIHLPCRLFQYLHLHLCLIPLTEVVGRYEFFAFFLLAFFSIL